ncbi:unnamed protein product [Timema podura]|uniref:Uncharacterized protein n=1 Tax=Timema podura TaxID=61482 RepID=A0ABN7NMA6_TIMPD|nr:unnamed protein product [Timema podura]
MFCCRVPRFREVCNPGEVIIKGCHQCTCSHTMFNVCEPISNCEEGTPDRSDRDYHYVIEFLLTWVMEHCIFIGDVQSVHRCNHNTVQLSCTPQMFSRVVPLELHNSLNMA